MTHEGSDKDLGNNRPANGDEEAWGGSWGSVQARLGPALGGRPIQKKE